MCSVKLPFLNNVCLYHVVADVNVFQCDFFPFYSVVSTLKFWLMEVFYGV